MKIRMTMKDLEAVLPSLGYSKSFQKNLRAAIRKCAKVYNTDLDRIPADLAAFDQKWGKGRVHVVPAPFRSAREFRDWRKNVRIALARVAGVPSSAPLNSSCGTVLAAVRGNQGKGKFLGPNSDITIEVVLRAASRDGLSPADITDEWIDRTALSLSSTLRKSFCRGLKGLNRIVERQSGLPELTGLLPGTPLPQPRELRPVTSNWRRKSANPSATMIWSDFDRIMHLKRYSEEEAEIEGTPAAFKDTSIMAYENSLNWLLRELAAEDLLEPGCDLKEVITQPNLVAAINRWIKARKARGQSAETSTLYCHVSRMVHLAIAYFDLSPKEAKRLVELRRKDAIRTKSVGKMSVKREKWIKDFDRDVAKQEKAHRLPEVLMKRSNAILARADWEGKVRPGEVMMALRMGIAAIATAILFRASPVRSTNLRTLRMRGEGAEFSTEQLMQDARLRELRLHVPGAQVKNRVTIDEIADDDLAPVVRWYLEEIRPRLIAAHPFGKYYVDSDYLFPSTSEGPMERSGFSATFRSACLEVGFDMEMHQARHVCAYWILSIDPNAWGEVAALLGDDEMTVRKYYGWLDKRHASEAARAKLREKRAFSGKQFQGDYVYAA